MEPRSPVVRSPESAETEGAEKKSAVPVVRSPESAVKRSAETKGAVKQRRA